MLDDFEFLDECLKLRFFGFILIRKGEILSIKSINTGFPFVLDLLDFFLSFG
jgi:hypothetical protein